jgi:hypothetical protein
MTKISTPPPAARCARFTHAVMGFLALITNRHRLHVVEHVGMFAGSFLHRRDWDHT